MKFVWVVGVCGVFFVENDPGHVHEHRNGHIGFTGDTQRSASRRDLHVEGWMIILLIMAGYFLPSMLFAILFRVYIREREIERGEKKV